MYSVCTAPSVSPRLSCFMFVERDLKRERSEVRKHLGNSLRRPLQSTLHCFGSLDGMERSMCRFILMGTAQLLACIRKVDMMRKACEVTRSAS